MGTLVIQARDCLVIVVILVLGYQGIQDIPVQAQVAIPATVVSVGIADILVYPVIQATLVFQVTAVIQDTQE